MSSRKRSDDDSDIVPQEEAEDSDEETIKEDGSDDELNYSADEFSDSDEYTDYESSDIDDLESYEIKGDMSNLQKACQMNVKTKGFMTPLHLATMRGLPKTMNFLLLNDALVDSQDSHGNTPLHLAVKARQKHLVEILLKFKANVNMQNKLGNTPLHIILNRVFESFDELHIMSILLLYGANPLLRNRKSRRAVDVAQETSKINCLDYVIEVNKMKGIKLNCKTTFYDFMIMSTKVSARYIDNIILNDLMDQGIHCHELNSFINLNSDFPNYRELIDDVYNKALCVKDLHNSTKPSLEILSNLNIPDLCYEEMLNYLNNYDLENINAAKELLERIDWQSKKQKKPELSEVNHTKTKNSIKKKKVK